MPCSLLQVHTLIPFIENVRNMKNEEALKIVCMIIEGLNPYKEKEVSKNLPETNPITIRAYIEILKALEDASYNEDDAAEILGMTSLQFSKKISDFGLDASVFAKSYFNNRLELTLNQFLEKIESQVILEALNKTQSKINETAELLGLTYRVLRHRIEKYNLYNKYDAPKTNYIERFLNQQSLDIFLKKIEREIIIDGLKLTNFKIKRTAEVLGIRYRALGYRIKAIEGQNIMEKF
jgi:DNA-binding NtrC family response regulator